MKTPMWKDLSQFRPFEVALSQVFFLILYFQKVNFIYICTNSKCREFKVLWFRQRKPQQLDYPL